MCGINLIIDKKSILDDTAIRKMNMAVRHRGPDAGRFAKFQKNGSTIYIGNNRLKIIDTRDEANQPFISPEGRYCLSFNGEIYNYKELKKEIEKEVTLKTSSDSEVLLHHLIKSGQEGINKLNGMFGFVFFDLDENKILIVRDRFGVKPVYYYESEDFFIASSELKGIFASGLVKKELNGDQIANYIRYKHARKPHTFYKNVFELEQGCLLDINETLQIKKWHSEKTTDQLILSDDDIVSKTNDLLVAAVTRQLQSDVSSGIFLSGGVDSTLLLAIIKELGIDKFPSYSIANSKADAGFGTDDYYYSALAANKYNSEHHVIHTDISILKDFDMLVMHTDQPVGDSASLLTYILSKETAKSITVALSGAGADELFAGYNRHLAFYEYLHHIKGHKNLIKLLNGVSHFIPTGFQYPLRKKARLLKKFAGRVSEFPNDTYVDFCGSEYLKDEILINKTIPDHVLIPENTDFFRSALEYDRNEYLISDVLAMTDKMSMRHSLEVRVPFLDNDLYSFINKLPSETLIKNGRKWILKSLLDQKGGEKFTSRSKEGFGMPIGKWLKSNEAKPLIEILKNKNNPLYNYVRYDKVEELIRLHLQNSADISSELWSLILLAGWLEKEFK